MELDSKQKVLVAIYTEYQKDIPNMNAVTPQVLGIEEVAFNVAVSKLQNEGYLQGAHLITVDQFAHPVKVVMSRAKMTRDGLDYVETKLEIDKTMSNSDKVRAVATKAGAWGVDQLKDLASKTLSDMLSKMAGF
ncbi:hypothetical protein JJB07_14780 [Tumebacillus sp. ITR2]|uniref:Uncharacterized protein n=1 Tax=Tumebacillus amylolyticus TaxID=2801339 RepID=A0ABS1JCB4_9BACL|nr:YjcQ family protein [Tumebacillus amylolyticus]MBL0387903.1 hypothetical protein [Tumebacillus amylolyticus]